MGLCRARRSLRGREARALDDAPEIGRVRRRALGPTREEALDPALVVIGEFEGLDMNAAPVEAVDPFRAVESGAADARDEPAPPAVEIRHAGRAVVGDE